jgi:glyoxylase-like metal-dependent hydrolase (beta-lactamase superfamily II)
MGLGAVGAFASGVGLNEFTSPVPNTVQSSLLRLSGGPDVPDFSMSHLALYRAREKFDEDPQSSFPRRVRWLPIVEGVWSEAFVRKDGSPRKAVPYTFASFQLEYADGHTVLIDPVNGRDNPSFEEKWLWRNSSEFSDDNFGELQRAVREAAMIVLGHGHWDHSLGMKDSGDERSWDQFFVTEEQRAHLSTKYGGWDEEAIDKIRPGNILRDQRFLKIAPGVVRIKAPGHTPGHSIFLIKTQDGQEYLHVGDIAYNLSNITDGVSRTNLLCKASGEDPVVIADQLRALMDVNTSRVELIVPHDLENLNRQTEAGKLKKGFR